MDGISELKFSAMKNQFPNRWMSAAKLSGDLSGGGLWNS